MFLAFFILWAVFDDDTGNKFLFHLLDRLTPPPGRG
jgi:hypothetical protein